MTEAQRTDEADGRADPAAAGSATDPVAPATRTDVAASDPAASAAAPDDAQPAAGSHRLAAPRRSRWRGDLVAGTSVAAVLAVLGVPVGLLWAAIAPRALVVFGSAGPDLVDDQTKAFIGADSWFLVLTGLAGIICGVLAFRFAGRRHGMLTALGVAVGGLAAGWIAARTGHQVGLAGWQAARAANTAGSTARLYLKIRATGVLVTWALAAELVFLARVAYLPRELAERL